MRSENERIKEVRKAMNLTLEAFGQRVGMKKSSLSHMESGTNAVSGQLCAVNSMSVRNGCGPAKEKCLRSVHRTRLSSISPRIW